VNELLTIEQCAKLADVSVSTIKRDILEGKLVPTRIRGAVRIAPQDWEEYLRKCRSVPTVEAGKFGFNTLGVGLAARLASTATRRSTSGGSSSRSPIIELAARRGTPSRKP
jgi:excisionase family DNA binding protein